jgi:hypothetical protein
MLTDAGLPGRAPAEINHGAFAQQINYQLRHGVSIINDCDSDHLHLPSPVIT